MRPRLMEDDKYEVCLAGQCRFVPDRGDVCVGILTATPRPIRGKGLEEDTAPNVLVYNYEQGARGAQARSCTLANEISPSATA